MTPHFENLTKLLTRRHSCRAFLDRQVEKDKIRKIAETAGRVPSWCNSQPWHVTVTCGDETDRFRAALIEAVKDPANLKPDVAWPAKYTGVYQERRRTCGWQLYGAVGVTKEDIDGRMRQSARNYELFDAPHCAILTTEADLGAYGMMDCGGFISAFTLAAEAMGISSIPQAAVAGLAPTIREFFSIPESRNIVCAISFGYADNNHPANSFRTERADADEILEIRG